MKETGIVYKVICKVNGKIYIGITTKTLNKRRQQHIQKSKYKKRLYVIHKAINKYGIDNFLFEIIDTFDGNKDACKKEIKYISLYNCFIPNGYNMTLGGEGIMGHKYSHSEETKNKISLTMMGIKKSEETKKNMSLAQKERKKWFKYNHSDDIKQIISKRMKLIPHKKMSEETKLKLRMINLGKKQSVKTIEKRRRSFMKRKEKL